MVSLADLASDIGLGLATAFSFAGLFYCFVGVTMGTLIGVLPGVGVLSTVAMLMPLTFYLDPTSAIIMLAGIYYGAAYGGSTASILLNLPGTAQTAVTCLDGYPMTKQGRAGIALFITTIASFVGSVVGIVVLAAFAIPLAELALGFRSHEYFALMLTGLVGAALMSSDAPFKSLAMVALGVLLGLVGTDVNSGIVRYSFGVQNFYDGLPLVAIALGLFGLPEVMRNAGVIRTAVLSPKEITFRSMLPGRQDWRRAWGAIARGTGVGSFFGALPGTGGMVASFMAYAVEKRVSRHDLPPFSGPLVSRVCSPFVCHHSAA